MIVIRTMLYNMYIVILLIVQRTYNIYN